MIIKSLMVQHWGGIINGVHLGEFSDGINIIYGPNGSGKSTIMDALSRGLFDRHKVQSIEIKDKQPWGRDVYPEVTIEFSQNGKQYRVMKRFLSKQDCQLWHTMNGDWELLAEGDKADDRLLGILDSEKTNRGATEPKHWGIAQLLWLPQGKVWFEENEKLNARSRNRLQNVLGDIIISKTYHALESGVKKLYDGLFTPKEAKLQARSEPKILEKELATAKENYNELKEQWDSLDGLNEEILGLQKEYNDIQERLRKAKEELEKGEKALEEAKKNASAREVAEAKSREKKAAWKAINERVRGLRGVREELGRLQIGEEEQKRIFDEYEYKIEKASEEAREAEEYVDELKSKQDDIQKELSLAENYGKLARIGKELSGLSDDLGKIRELQEQRDSLEEQVKDLDAPSDSEIKKLTALRDAVRDANTRLEASALKIQFKPQIMVEGIAKRDGREESFIYTSQNDEPLEWQAVQNFDLDIRGLANFSVYSGSDKARNLKADMEEKEQELGLALGRFGGLGIDELVEKNEDAKRLKGQIKELDIQEKTYASKGVKALENELDLLENRQNQLLRAFPDLENEEISAERADEMLGEAKLNQKKLSDEIQKAEKNQRLKEKAFRDLEKKQMSTREELIGTRTAIKQQEEREKELTSDTLTDAERKEKLDKALDELDLAEQSLDRIPKLDNLKELEERKRILGDDAKKFEARSGEIKSRLDQRKGALDQLEGQGLYSKMAKVEEKVALLESRYESEINHAYAVKLLGNTLAECRQEAMKSVVEPVNQRVSQAFQQITGDQYGEISFDNEFMPRTINIQSRDVQIGPDALSYGTKEQLNILVRLTLGEILAENERQRQIVVLDDPLAHTDADRQNGMLELFDRASNNLQLVILTCHPEDYEGIEARGFDLEELKRSNNV